MKKGCSIVIFSILGACVLLVFGLVILVAAFSGRGSMNFINEPVAVVKIEGPIFDVEDTLAEMEDLRLSPDVKVVVLRINSPGGAVAPSQEVYREVLKLKESGKIVVASLGTVAASGGYYIASACTKIVANTGTITGSIGVIMESFGMQELIKTLQLEPRTIKSGKFKDVGSPFRGMSDDEKNYLQSLSDTMYGLFVDDVAKARALDVNRVKEIAEGRIYTGSQAKDVGLVDEIGNLYDAIDLAKKAAGLPVDAEVRWPKKPSPFEALFGEKAMAYYANKILMWTGSQGLPQWRMPATGF